MTKKIFPRLQAMTRRGHLDGPVVGVARSDWTLEQFRARARESIERHGPFDEATFARLHERLRYVRGDYGHPGTMEALRRELGAAQGPCTISPFPRACSRPWSGGSGDRVAPATRASSSRSRSAATSPRRER